MKFSLKAMVTPLCVTLLMANNSLSYAQNFFFEFGKTMSLENITFQRNEQERLIKWINVNTTDSTWSLQGGELICTGLPIGVVRTEKQYENFILHIEWKHREAGGNSGVFVWSNANPNEQSRLPDGVEVQMLELDWVKLNKQQGKTPPIAYVHGELFGVGGVEAKPDNPRGSRSKSIENRAKGRGQWNSYDVVCIDGVVKLAVNGKFVNGLSHSSQKKGYLCLESEGAQIHFRNMKIIELPPGVTSVEQTAPQLHEIKEH